MNQTGKDGRLGEVEIAGMLVEVRQRGCLDSVRLVPVKDLVEVELKYLIFRVGLFNLDRKHQLTHLADVGLFTGEQEPLHQLLRDG